jgi:hypothetical protein
MENSVGEFIELVCLYPLDERILIQYVQARAWVKSKCRNCDVSAYFPSPLLSVTLYSFVRLLTGKSLQR